MKSCFRDRTLHVLDVENLVGAPSFGITDVERIGTQYLSRVSVGATDHMWLACSHHNAEAVFFGWPCQGRRLLGSGPNGADLALIEPLLLEEIHEHYSRIFIGSGDGAFLGPAAWLAARGVAVVVVSRALSLSRSLGSQFPFVLLERELGQAA